MPKMKTKKAASKRFKVTAKGHVKRQKGNRSHLLGKKTTKRKRSLKKPTLVNASFEKSIRTLLQQ